jgi:HTH-type transcriptional regulator, sugar sensing transcriptional regulator
MSQQSVIEELQRLGMSGYEAKAYVALVTAGLPLNGYEVAKRSGVPRSTVYETLAKLVARGAAYEVRVGEAKGGYISLPPNVPLDRMRRDFDQSIDALRDAMAEVASPPQVRLVHNLSDRASLLARAADVVAAARKDVFLSGWPPELEPLKPAARRAEADGVDVSVVTFGEDPEPVGQKTPHRFSAPEVVLKTSAAGCSSFALTGNGR